MEQSIALALLENIVHMSRQDYPTGYVVVSATIPDHILIIDHAHFLNARAPHKGQERRAGDAWLVSLESAVLRVPSAVVTDEWNYLINPEHLDFAQIAISSPAPMNFDERLFVK